MCVIDWKSTCGSPIECTRSRSNDRETTPASIEDALLLSDLPRSTIFPWRRIVCPAPAEHRRDDSDFGELLGLEVVGIAVEHDEVREEAGEQLAPAVLVAGEPGRVYGRGPKRLVKRQALLRVPGTGHARADPVPGSQLFDRRVRSVGEESAPVPQRAVRIGPVGLPGPDALSDLVVRWGVAELDGGG